MIKKAWGELWDRFVNRETISYFIFGVLTTAVDWIVYPIMRWFDYSVAFSTAISWAAAVLFAFVTNKLFVFQSLSFRPAAFFRELFSFVSCRLLTGLLTIGAMVLMVDTLGWNEWFGKILVSAMSLVLNYILSKLFIFKNKILEEVNGTGRDSRNFQRIGSGAEAGGTGDRGDCGDGEDR